MNQRISRCSVRWGLCLVLFLSACAPAFQEVRVADVPVKVYKPGTQDVDIDIVWESVTKKLGEMLPGAYFQGMVFSGKCQDLLKLQGKLVLVFAQVRPAIPQQRVVRATISVDVTKQTMGIHLKDESNFYPSTRRLALDSGLSVKEVAAIAYQHIIESGLSDCDVTLSQSDRTWDVRCGPLDNFVQECRFEIDASSGAISRRTK
jgi:hypothetical protein